MVASAGLEVVVNYTIYDSTDSIGGEQVIIEDSAIEGDMMCSTSGTFAYCMGGTCDLPMDLFYNQWICVSLMLTPLHTVGGLQRLADGVVRPQW